MRSLHHERGVRDHRWCRVRRARALDAQAGVLRGHSKGTRNERKPTSPVRTAQRDRNQSAPLKDETRDLLVELSGKDEARQNEDASVEL